MAWLWLFLQRIAAGLLLLVGVLVVNFTLVHLAPGDVADTIAGEMGGADAEVMAAIRRDYGLDQPFWVQLGRYLAGVAQLDLGHSFFFNRPVLDLILERLPATLLLVVSAQLLAIMAGTLLGVLAARRPNGLLSHLLTTFSLVFYAAPVFWTGMLLLILFASVWPLFPVAGMRNIALEGGFWLRTLDILHHLVLPMVTLATIYLANYSRLARASMMEVLEADYIRTARAKGLGESSVVFKHGLRNAVLPVVTVAGLQFANVISGAVLVETVFSWPGLGTLALDAILGRDAPTLLGILFFSALMVVVVNLITDLSYRLIDPRIRGHGAR
ncbi:MAG: ABC transporter permease [Candidatus Competibacterales bacterium]